MFKLMCDDLKLILGLISLFWSLIAFWLLVNDPLEIGLPSIVPSYVDNKKIDKNMAGLYLSVN